MANKSNPTGNSGLSVNLLPNFYQTTANKKFLQATIDQLYQPGTVTKTSGYIGRKNAKAASGRDIFIEAADAVRTEYQLEPGLSVTDSLGNITFFKDYIDYVNQIGVFGGNTTNHARLNKQEFYSWDPHIDWDKFVNFQNYYWMPYGPDTIEIHGQQLAIASTLTVDIQLSGSTNEYLFTPNGLSLNPVLKLYRGQTYTFEINSVGNPFSLKTNRSTGIFDRYIINGIDNYGVETGTITFIVPDNAPSLLYYQSETDINLGGAIEIYDIVESTILDVEHDILGKKTYTLADGTLLSNGMKLIFAGNVSPASYGLGQYYVEGVGIAIKLVPAAILEIVSPYTLSESIQFDSLPFDKQPFDDATGFASQIDYITVNRSSRDHNPWSRYNRWFHKDIIAASAMFNGNQPSLDQSTRAIRPIIEFQADLKLFNMGTTAVVDVDLIDDFTTDVFSIIEGSRGYNVDGEALSNGQLLLVTADTDPMVANKIYRVEFVNIQGYPQIHLAEIASPVINEVTLIKHGKKNQSLMYWFNGVTWQKGQQKVDTNQAPMFDVVDDNGISYGDISVYNGSTFAGTKVFSYKVGTGTADTELNFPLSYQNVSNIGDIVFNFNLTTDTFQYKVSSAITTQAANIGYLLTQTYGGSPVYVNGWQRCNTTTLQAAVRIYNNSNITNNFNIDIFDNINALNDLIVKIYVNGIRLDANLWSLSAGTVYYQVVLKTPITVTDILTIRAFASQPVNSNGYYEIPLNLQNNPLNNSMADFTLGEVADHVNSIIDNVPPALIDPDYANDIDDVHTPEFTVAGQSYDPDYVNIRDLGNITQYGTKFVQHSGPLSLGIYHVTSQSNNVVHAIERSRDDYNNFKRTFLTVASTLGVDTNASAMVELVMQRINANKPKTTSYYFSDMVPYGAKITTELTVVDYRITEYPLSAVFTLDKLSNKSVGVYLNGMQLTHGKDYTFDNQGSIAVTAPLVNGDTITTYEYDSTDGSFVPATPTKLGIWPKYEPKIYTDTTLVTPRTMIQGHDGSQVLAYGDYRDDLILELEKRIYNNIKVQYDTSIFDITDVLPGYSRANDYSLVEFNKVLAPNFYKWTGLVGEDFTKPLSFDRANSFTFNYSENTAPDGRPTPGYWRGVYRWLLDTDRPNLCPWEMLGFSAMPAWWTSVYGPAPYTSDNLLMWQDLAAGMVKEPGKPAIKLEKYVRPFLLTHIPVDESGNLLSPLMSGLASGTITQSTDNNFVFGDGSPVETAWTRSSHYPFSVLIASMLLTPAKTFGLLLDRSRIVRNLAGQLVYSDTKLRIRPTDIVLPSLYTSAERVQTAGIINYIVDYILNFVFSNSTNSYTNYANDLNIMIPQLSYRVGAFTNGSQFKLLLDSKTPSSTGSVFIPAEDYNVFLNTSSAVQKLTYSGVIITKLSTGYEVKGYSVTQPYFNVYAYTRTGTTLNVGGISTNFTMWTPGQKYAAGSVVKVGNAYYSVISTTTAGATFDPTLYAPMSALPITGGATISLRSGWDTSDAIAVPYGTTFSTVQEVADFLAGYGEYLTTQGFIFDTFNPTLGLVTNWETSVKEFLFWTTQNWSTGQDKWTNWIPEQPVSYGSIVRYNGDYYSAVFNITPEAIFDETKYVKLDGLSNIGSSVISLSPAAGGVTFKTTLTVVDDVSNAFNNYEIFKVDGTPIPPRELNSQRVGNIVTYTPTTTAGIYGASFYLIQNEHVIVINNTTIFNDTIYNPESGYRQERIKVSGYVTTDWYGGLDIPGFIFDQAVIISWQAWQDYNMGDIITHQGFYYSADSFTAGSASFVASDWVQLEKRPVPKILPNWTNIAGQFTEFYNLDVAGFDTAQQSVAQHLVGYQKRQYLQNIIQDDVSEFKFFQGMIREKGTQNVLNKLFDVLSSDNAESLTFYEEWALRVGQYGANAAFENIEFTLTEGQFKNNPQCVALVSRTDTTLNPFIIQQTPNDIYLKPLGYTSHPFPVLAEYAPLLRSAGYVNPSDVFVSINTIADITSQDITTFNNGSYVWCAFEGPSWNVYRFTDMDIRAIAVTYTTGVLTITTENIVKLKVGSYVGLTQVTLLNGFYKITSVTLNAFTVAATITGFPSPFTQQEQLVIYALQSQRTSSIDTIDSILPAHIIAGELLWTDDAGTGTWASWKYNEAYTQTSLTNTAPQLNLNYGAALAINTGSTMLAISTAVGQVITHDKVGIAVPWVQRQVIQEPFIAAEVMGNPPNLSSLVATVVAFSTDATWMATGSPFAGYAATHYVGEFATGHYDIGDIVSVAGTFFEALQTMETTVLPTPASLSWAQLLYVPVSTSGTNSAFASQGVISLYKKDDNNIYSLVDTIVGPTPTANENFGSTLVFSDNVLYIGAAGYSSNTGRVYAMSYSTIVNISSSYNPVGSVAATIVVSSTTGIRVGMVVQGTGFTQGQSVISIVDGITLILSGSPDSTPTGVLQFVTTGWGYNAAVLTGSSAGSNFGSNLVISKDTQTLLISASGGTVTGKVYVYQNINSVLTLLQTLTGIDTNFGKDAAVSYTGNYIAVSDDISSAFNFNQLGNVSVYEKGIVYSKYQDLVDHRPEIGGRFGNKIEFMNDYDTLVVYSQGGSTIDTTIFDSGTLTFDKESTAIAVTNLGNGRIDVYDRYATKWVFSESLPTSNVQGDNYGASFAVGENHILVGAPSALDKNVVSGMVYDYSKAVGNFTWSIDRTQIAIPDVSKVKKAFMYNKVHGTLVTYLDVVDPAQGKIPGIADEEIKFKAFYDPAVYSIGTELVNVNIGSYWSKAQVGMLWWDLRTAKFLNSYFDDVAYRNNTWNTLAPGASIDVYEWVESALLPANWDIQADTPAGLAIGISGTSLYGNTAYSVRQRYDNVSKTFKNTYYYWVKNKRITPNALGRKMAAQGVASLIANPRGQGYSYLALTGVDSFSLVNAKQHLSDSEVVLSIEYWTIDKVDQNVHSQWKLISDDAIVDLPNTIERKWFDSLCGVDIAGRQVPDLRQPPKLRYGVENRPRQSMFVNRIEALKQFVEKVNQTLLVNQISENYNISPLNSFDPVPSMITGLYDTVLDTEIELGYANIGSFTRPVVAPIITDGKITGVTIITSGRGYLNAPPIEMVGSGKGAIVTAIINTIGQITGAIIKDGGEGYTDSTTCVVRDYSVLISSDSTASGDWSIYSYDPINKLWSRILTQSYDVRAYWTYTDWFATGYNQFSAPDHAVNTFVELNSITASVGELVKILIANTGGWLLLYKYTTSTSVDWTQTYSVVGIQNGTIQLSSMLYKFDGTAVGYDASTFDGGFFDIVASKELRIILDTLRNNVFIGVLKQSYLDLFLAAIRYAHSEQIYLDWAFKTSFVRATHNVGTLGQPVTYPIDNLSNFEEYIAEVKPYRTKIREYISDYTSLDVAPSAATDFDLQPFYESGAISTINASVENGVIVADNTQIRGYPWKFWLDNVGFTIMELVLVNGGTGYITEPQVVITSDSGTGATARAFFTNGIINRIVLLTPGSGYLSAPVITINGGLSTTGTAARVIAIIGDSVARSSLISLKFDRVTHTYFITDLQKTETFTGTSSKLQFPLQWGPDVRVNQSTVSVNGIPVLRELYTLAIVKSTKLGFTSYAGSITFITAPASGSTIIVNYLKDVSLLNASDRIQYYYDPATGELGKDLAQLMTGIDYGGVQVNGLGFDLNRGWGELPYTTEGWDVYDAEFSDYIVQVAANTHSFTMPYVPTSGTILNAYHVQQNTTTHVSDGTTLRYTFNLNAYPPAVSVIRTVTSSGINIAGSMFLVLASTNGINLGDVVTTSAIANAFGYGTFVTTIINSTTVELSQIIFVDIAAASDIMFTRKLSDPIDVTINPNGTLQLTSVITAGSVISITGTLDPIRLEQSLITSPSNGVADGISPTVVINSSVSVADGDTIIIRKNTSDGSLTPSDLDYDTAITGGNMAYSSASGLAADDIVLDGDDFVTATSSPAPEEVVPGQVVDAVAIKVFDKSSSGAASIKVDSHTADGISGNYSVSQTPNSPRAIIVKHNALILTYGIDYTIDYANKMVTMTTIPVIGTTISIFSIGFSGSNILDLDYFVGDGTTREFLTHAHWLSSLTSLVYVDGQTVTPELFNTDTTYDLSNVVGIRFAVAPAAGALINFIIVSGDQQTFAITKTEVVPTNGGLTYTLQYPIGNSLPNESNMIVRVDQNILEAPNNSYFTISSNKLSYTIDPTKFLPSSVDITNIVVLASGTMLQLGRDYTVDLAGITVKLNKVTYKVHSGQQLVVSITTGQGYTYNSSTGQITFAESYDNTHIVEVISSYVHDILNIERTSINVTSSLVLTPDTVEFYYYKGIASGQLPLDRAVINDNYVWVIKNNTLLTPSIDYRLNDDYKSIVLAVAPSSNDKITLMTFGNNVLAQSGIAYMQFKDMLNRVSYKRLSASKQTTLATELNWNDTTIILTDASNFGIPNPVQRKPGIIEIRGERIEYFEKNGNTLSRLRRGTLGTGVHSLNKAGAFVQDIGASETIPYMDTTITEQILSDGTTSVKIGFVPESANVVEVFVGGYNDSASWESNVAYSVEQIVHVGSYTYKCATAHTSSTSFTADTANWVFFVGNIRLKKQAYSMFNVNSAPYSPAGDVLLDADFTVDGTTAQITLNTALAVGTRVTVIKQTGIAWDNTINVLDDTTKISKFLTATPGIWYAEYKK